MEGNYGLCVVRRIQPSHYRQPFIITIPRVWRNLGGDSGVTRLVVICYLAGGCLKDVSMIMMPGGFCRVMCQSMSGFGRNTKRPSEPNMVR